MVDGMTGLTFRQLEVFVAAVESGGMRACAERLSISQMAVSEHIRSLEKQLGRRLFQRRRGAVAAPSEAGQEAYWRARRIVAEIRELVGGFETGEGGVRLRIAAHGYIVERISRRLTRFGADHPEVALELERRNFEGVLAGLRGGEIDVGFFLSHGAAPALDSILAWREELALYVAPNHPLAAEPCVASDDLVAYPFVQLPARSHLRLQVDSALAALDLDRCGVVMASDDLALVLESLAGGASFACLFATGGDALAAGGRIARLRLHQAIPPLDVRYAASGQADHDRLIGELTRWLP